MKAKRKTANQKISAMKCNDLKRLVLALQETLYPTDEPDRSWDSDTAQEVGDLLERFGLGGEL